MSLRRRDFITLLGGAAAAWPLAARAQQGAMPVIGFLDPGTSEPGAITAFLKGLADSGYLEGRNVTIEYRWGQNELNRLPELAADLVRRRVAVIAAPQSSAAALAAKAATAQIPVIFGSGIDPVEAGLVASLNRPGANVTGINYLIDEFVSKRLELLHLLIPGATRIAVLSVPNVGKTGTMVTDLTTAVESMGLQVEFLYASSNHEIDAAFAGLAEKRADALLVNPAPTLLFQNRRVQFALLAARYKLPVMYPSRLYTEAGGLMSYGTDSRDQTRQVGVYVGRILKGEKPTDLPVIRATKFELIINQQAAGTIGIAIPPMLLAIADEVIE
jgi:putative tryptophan/tyrosine transport system substrate-binding protein